MKQKKRRWALWLLPFILAGCAAGWYYLKGRKAQAASAVVQQRTATVERGVLNVTLSGSGSVHPAVTADIKVEADGTVKENFMEEGKIVGAGDTLLTLKDEDTGIAEKKLRNTLEQKQLAYRKLVEQYSALNISAPIGGEITELTVSVGDEIKAGAALMTITDTSALTAEVSFENTSIEAIGSDQILLHLPDYMTTLPAVIRSGQQDGSNTIVTVLVDNPGILKPGIEIWCEAEGREGTLASTAGVLQWNHVETVSAKVAGTVQSLSAGKGGMVNEGMALIVLYDDEAEVNLENARLQVEEAQYNLDQSQVEPGKYTVTAPMDGYLTPVRELVPGDSVKTGEVLASSVNMDEMEFTISIDELDINKVSEGQDVLVTAEAIEDTQTDPMMGKVTGIALEGNASNGVATYPVTITVPGREGLKAGMNVDAGIQVVNREDVILAPLEALQKRGDSYMVWVKTGETGQNNPENGLNPGTGGFSGMTDGQREELRQQMQNMTEEERQAMRQRMGNSAGRGTNAGQGDVTDWQGNVPAWQGEATTSQGSLNRSASDSNDYYEGAILVPVKTGLYNENYMEITEGLKEGDIVILPQQTSNATTGAQTTGGLNMPGGGLIGGGGLGGGSFFGGGGRR